MAHLRILRIHGRLSHQIIHFAGTPIGPGPLGETEREIALTDAEAALSIDAVVKLLADGALASQKKPVVV